MIPAEFHVEPATWSVDMTALRGIRTEVFVWNKTFRKTRNGTS